MQRYHQGKYRPRNPKKWKFANDITFRSGIEYRFFRYFDNHPNVKTIASERVIVPYFDPVQNKQRRYFVDLYVEIINSKNETKKYLIEIKCEAESKEPKKQSRITEAYKSKVKTFATNLAKWEAAEKYCMQRGWEFKVFTDKDLR